eukprot:4088451-Heterocapsa_arctica.AAC.1
MRPPVPPVARQPDMISQALSAAPVQARALSAPVRAPNVAKAKPLMAAPGSVPKMRSSTPKAKPLLARPHAPPLAPTVGQDAGGWD